MAGSTNFLQWDSGKANIETDVQYNADTMRSGGAVSGVFPSPLANKLFYQLATMVAALGQMLSNKGYTISDSDFNALVAALSNIRTNVDIYAKYLAAPQNLINWSAGADWTDVDITSYIGSDVAKAAMLSFRLAFLTNVSSYATGLVRKKGSSATSDLAGISASQASYNVIANFPASAQGFAIVDLDASFKFQTNLVITGSGMSSLVYRVNLLGYLI